MTNTTPTSGAAEIATRLRNACASVRNKSYPLADLIPLMQQAADALASAAAPAEQPAPSAAEATHNVVDWSSVGLLLDAHATTRQFVTGTSNWAAAICRYMADHSAQPSPTPQADIQPASVVGTIAHVGTGKTTLVRAIASALRAAPAEQPNTAYAALPMESAPKDGTMLRLQVMFEDGALEDDNSKPIWTIGFNNLGNTGEDEWQFAGWNWSHDCFSVGTGTPVGWLPMLDASSASHGQAPAGATPWRSAVLDLIDECPGLTMEQDHWLSRRVKELDFPSAPRHTAQEAPAATPQADSQPVILHQEAACAMLKEMDMNDRALAAIDADPKKCTAQVRCINGRITTESCTTKAPLISNGESSDGERDYYICPDCRKDIIIDYREN